MIIGADRRTVIENIRTLAEGGRFHEKAETGDPCLTAEECHAITDRYLRCRKRPLYRIKTALGVGVARIGSRILNRDTEIRGLDNIPKDLGGVLITSNHFNPLENTVIRHLVAKLGRARLGIISQTSNFAMTGALGFLMNYADTIPISAEPHYLARDLMGVLRERLVERGDAILLYPEQEMWFNYRKPRPPQEGAYYYAARLNVPILSCFVEILSLDEDENEEFKRVRYVLHVLGLLRPDAGKSVHENTEALAARDFALKRACYEQVYGRPLTYDFSPADIAGWKGTL